MMHDFPHDPDLAVDEERMMLQLDLDRDHYVSLPEKLIGEVELS